MACRETKALIHYRTAAAPIAITALMLAATAPLAAQDKKSESSYVVALRDCQGKTDPTERLTCYDAAVNSIVSASGKGDVTVVEREDVRQTRRKLFGFALPDLGIFGGKSDKEDPEQAEEFTTLQTTIASVRSGAEGSYVITTEEGAEWQLSEVPARLLRPRVGHPVEIRAGALSSYFLRINGQKGVKGRRIR
jgi:hypothetical protein